MVVAYVRYIIWVPSVVRFGLGASCVDGFLRCMDLPRRKCVCFFVLFRPVARRDGFVSSYATITR